jgi:WD40 repeat protein
MSNHDFGELSPDSPRSDRAAHRWNSAIGTFGLVFTAIFVWWSGSETTQSATPESSLTSQTVLTWPRHPVFNLTWSTDSRKLAASGFGPVIRVWNRESGVLRSYQGGSEQPRFALGWSEDGRQLMVSGLDLPIESWDLNVDDESTGPIVRRPSNWEQSLEVLIRTCGARPIRLWGTSDLRFGLRSKSSQSANSIAFANDGRFFATGGIQGRLEISHAKSREHFRTIEVDPMGITAVSFSSDSSRLATSGPGPLRIWDVESGRELARLGDEQSGSANLGFSPDGSKIAVAAWDGSIRIWDLKTKQAIHKLRGHQGQVLSLAWSPDGKTLASSGYDTTVRVWDLTEPAR